MAQVHSFKKQLKFVDQTALFAILLFQVHSFAFGSSFFCQAHDTCSQRSTSRPDVYSCDVRQNYADSEPGSGLESTNVQHSIREKATCVAIECDRYLYISKFITLVCRLLVTIKHLAVDHVCANFISKHHSACVGAKKALFTRASLSARLGTARENAAEYPNDDTIRFFSSVPFNFRDVFNETALIENFSPSHPILPQQSSQSALRATVYLG